MAGAYNPKAALFQAYPRMRQLSKDANTVMENAECTLAAREERGCDTSFARARLYEAEWRINCTNDWDKACYAVERLKNALELSDPPGALTQDAEGSFAPGTEVFFLKLDRSTDQLLAREWPWRRPPIFLEPIDDPIRMVTYLQDLTWSDVVRCGHDNRKELNLALSVIARLVYRGGQAGYLNRSGFLPVFERFIRDWQDPGTGFFGMTYVVDDSGHTVRTTDLSLTFHVVRYAPHLVRYWQALIDTLLAIKDGQYPQGWLENLRMTDHNNYDVVELFARAWPQMRTDQRRRVGGEVKKMFEWCLDNSVTESGKLRKPDKGDQVCDSYYFAAAFLDTIGFFDQRRRFWTEAAPPIDPEPIRSGMLHQLDQFNADLTVVDDARERLGAGRRPWSNAIL